MSRQFILYTGTLCHLCDQARTVVYGVLPAGVRVLEINIDDSPALRERYGFRIPVFAVIDSDGNTEAEKGWPFTAGQIKRMLATA